MCGEANALRLATGEAAAAAVEREVSNAHVDNEFCAGEYFAEYFVSHLFLLGLEPVFEMEQTVVEFGQIQFGHFTDMHAVHFEGKAFGFEPVAVAFGTGDRVHEAGSPFLQGGGVFVGGHLHDVVDNALEIVAMIHFVGILHSGEVAGAIEDGVHGVVGE